MKLALFGDVHGNPDALRTCLDAIDDLAVDERYFLGDLVGYLPGELESLTLLADTHCQQGNHDAMLLGDLPTEPSREEIYKIAAARERLDPQALELLASWPTQRRLSVNDRDILLVHGSPEDPLGGYLYPDTDLASLQTRGYDIIFTAHTHRPFIRRYRDTTVVNVGSVGLPRDTGDLSAFAIYSTDTGECSIHRVRFDAEAVIARWGDDLHVAVRDCLRRVDLNAVGEVL